MRRTVQPVWLLATEMPQVSASVMRFHCRFRCYHLDRCHCHCYWALVSVLLLVLVLVLELVSLRDHLRRQVGEFPMVSGWASQSESESNQRRRSLQLSRLAE